MNICILVPSEDQMAQAGVRIRYRRIEPLLRANGHDLRIVSIDDLGPAAGFADDVYLLSKCQDARACVAAELLRANRRLVGIDLFDDYYSQSRDSRFTRFRAWLTSLLPSIDFALCSTPGMHELAMTLAPGLAAHVMNDPAPSLDADAIRFVAQRKLEMAHRKETLNVAWFGMGDNPYFPVGLSDLVAFAGELARLRGRGFEVSLSVLTNQRAMTGESLAMLKRLPVPYTLDEWTEERERQLLGTSLACFLPVNDQSFSVVKSLNRAVSALCTGTQVISAGYPLYESLAPFIYRDARRLAEDLRNKSLALRADTVPELIRLMEQWADPATEAAKLLDFLGQRLAGLPAAAPPPASRVAVIHGRNLIPEIHRFAQRMDALSVGSPFCTGKASFDLRFQLPPDGEECEVLIGDRHCAKLDPDLQGDLASVDAGYRKLGQARFAVDTAGLLRMDSSMSVAASYPSVMAGVERTLQRLFPGIRCYHADRTALPWLVRSPDRGAA